MLPIILDQKNIEELIKYAERKETITIDLNDQTVVFGNNRINFDIDPFKKKCLLEGLDDIALSLEKSSYISSYEKKINTQKPWVNLDD